MSDLRHMRHALSLGRRGLGRAWPNPSVGCVIVREGRVIGRGVTGLGGRPHAEREALAQAGAAARGATAYVTLEPCSHHGQTPPCAEALISAGVARVVSALEDPDPRVAGRGHALLKSAGITVKTGVCAAEAERDHCGFLSRVRRGRPMVTLKLASSFDGRIATASGESQWITSPQARRFTHGLRASHDAVMVGAGTARSDDPQLTVRELGLAHQPVRVVLSSKLDLPQKSALTESIDAAPLWLCHGPEAPQERIEAFTNLRATCISAPKLGRFLQISNLLGVLAERGLTRIFCEGGSALAASLLQADLVDHLVGMTAGMALGAEGLPAIGALGLEALAEAPRFDLVQSMALGGDICHIWERRPIK